MWMTFNYSVLIFRLIHSLTIFKYSECHLQEKLNVFFCNCMCIQKYIHILCDDIAHNIIAYFCIVK